MGARERGPLTEAMFYTLMVLARRDVCGTEIAQAVAERTAGRVKLGPGTLGRSTGPRRRGAPGVWLPPAKFRNGIWGVSHGHPALRKQRW